MIIVTGATGNVGQHVVNELAALGQTVRALSRKVPTNETRANVSWVAADFNDPVSLAKAMEGGSRLVLISPAHRDMQAHQTAIVDAAIQAGITKIAKLSGLGAGPEAPIRLPQKHYAIEQYIVDTEVDYSFVRPNLFMQVLLGSAQSIAGDGKIYAPAGDGAISFIDARDVALVLVEEVLNNGKAICEITGPQALSYQQAAKLLGDVINRPVQHVNVTPAQARESMLSMGMDEWLVEAFLELFDIYRAGHGSAVLSGAVKACIGTDATPLTRFFNDYRQAFLLAA